MIFNYGYGCCAFAQNICGSQPEVLDGMPDTSKPLSREFLINSRCPSSVAPAKVESIDVRPGEMKNAPEMEAPAAVLEKDHGKVGEHLSATEVGPGKEPSFSA